MQYGSTALMFAANNGHLQVAQELLKHGANVEAKNKVMQGDGVGVGGRQCGLGACVVEWGVDWDSVGCSQF